MRKLGTLCKHTLWKSKSESCCKLEKKVKKVRKKKLEKDTGLPEKEMIDQKSLEERSRRFVLLLGQN